jgi:hypothetical protein
VVYEPGTEDAPFLVVVAGQLQLVRPSETGDTLITALVPRQFTGEANMLAGHRPTVRVLATEATEVLQLTRAQLLAVVQTDAELGEILMRAYSAPGRTHRRVGLVMQYFSAGLHSSGALRMKEFSTRNGHPYALVDLDRDPDVQELLDRFGVAVEDVPVVICRGDIVLRNPRAMSALITPWRPRRKAAQELTNLAESRKKRSTRPRRLKSAKGRVMQTFRRSCDRLLAQFPGGCDEQVHPPDRADAVRRS